MTDKVKIRLSKNIFNLIKRELGNTNSGTVKAMKHLTGPFSLFPISFSLATAKAVVLSIKAGEFETIITEGSWIVEITLGNLDSNI